MVERLKEYEKGKRPQQITDSNPTFFDPRSGEPIVWYYRSKGNRIEIFDLMGFDPDTGGELTPITEDAAEEWKIQHNNTPRAPNRVDPQKYTFFDPLIGNPLAWYWLGADGSYEFYDGPGFQPQTGDPLKIATKDVVDTWKKSVVLPGHPPHIVDPNTYPFFNPVTGAPQVWYWHGNNGAYEFYDGPGYQPKTGEKLQIASRDVVEKWKHDTSGSGRQLRQKTAEFLDALYREVSDLNSNPLTSANNDYADQVSYYGKTYSREQIIAEQKGFNDRWPIRQYKMQQGSLQINCDEQSLTCSAKGLLDFDSRSPARNQRSSGVATFEYELKFASLEAPPNITLEAGEVRTRNVEPYSPSSQTPLATSAPGTRCDELAANPSDRAKPANVAGVKYDLLKIQSADAIANCEIAAKDHPDQLRFQYQFARSLEVTGDTANRQKAFVILKRLAASQYPAAFDNLGWLYLTLYPADVGYLNAIPLFRAGVLLGDSDAMLSLAEMIIRGRYTPTSEDETVFALITRAAQLGNQSAQNELPQIQQELQIRQQNGVSQQQVQQMFGVIVRGMLQNVGH
jgi:TPR repeat protein